MDKFEQMMKDVKGTSPAELNNDMEKYKGRNRHESIRFKPKPSKSYLIRRTPTSGPLRGTAGREFF